MQKTWAELRRRAALMDGTTDEQNNPIYNPAYWRTSANMTLYRIEWMRHFKGDLVSTEVTGSYLDGMGGILSIEKTEDGDWKFACNVVRGVSMDTGFVRGVAKVEGNVGTWVDTDGKAFVGARPATIELIHQDNWVRLIPQDTRYYQGARAYFDGTYLKVTDAVERFPQMNQAP